MPSRTDLYFTPEDSAAETERMPNAEYRPIDSILGAPGRQPALQPGRRGGPPQGGARPPGIAIRFLRLPEPSGSNFPPSAPD